MIPPCTDKEDEISKEDEDPSDKEFSDYEGYDYSDDFEEEIPDYEDIQDIPDLTAPGVRHCRGSKSEIPRVDLRRTHLLNTLCIMNVLIV